MDQKIILGLISGFFEKIATETRQRVSAILFNDKGKILVGKNPRHGVIVLPGGGMKPKENILETAQRESLEEAGITSNQFKKIPGKTPKYYNPVKKINSQTHYVLGKANIKNTSLLGDDNDVLLNKKFISIKNYIDILNKEKKEKPEFMPLYNYQIKLLSKLRNKLEK